MANLDADTVVSGHDKALHWETIINTSTPQGAKVNGGKYTAHARGNFSGSATVEIQYSSDGSDYTSIDSTNLLFSAEGVYNLEIAAGYLNVVLSGGDGSTDIDVTVKPIPRG